MQLTTTLLLRRFLHFEQDSENPKIISNALRTGNYDFNISVKPCVIAKANRTHQRVHIVFGYKDPNNFLCLTQDVDQNMW